MNQHIYANLLASFIWNCYGMCRHSIYTQTYTTTEDWQILRICMLAHWICSNKHNTIFSMTRFMLLVLRWMWSLLNAFSCCSFVAVLLKRIHSSFSIELCEFSEKTLWTRIHWTAFSLYYFFFNEIMFSLTFS